MSRKKIEADQKQRIQVVATHEQAEILNAAADKAKCSDRSTFILAHALRAAGATGVAGAPVVIVGEVADRLREEAKRQGVTADRVLEQLLITAVPQ